VLTDDGPLPLDVPRDRAGTFEPRLIAKQSGRFTGFHDKIPRALRARDDGVRDPGSRYSPKIGSRSRHCEQPPHTRNF